MNYYELRHSTEKRGSLSLHYFYTESGSIGIKNSYQEKSPFILILVLYKELIPGEESILVLLLLISLEMINIIMCWHVEYVNNLPAMSNK